jgi:hypothetical protein
MSVYIGGKYQWVENIVNGSASPGNQQRQLNFGPQNYLNNSRITSIEIFTQLDVPVTPQSNTTATYDQIAGSSLTLYMTDPLSNTVNKGNWIFNTPLVILHRVDNNVDPFVRDLFLLNGPIIDWEKSYISLSTPLSNTTNVSFLFNVGYITGKPLV